MSNCKAQNQGGYWKGRPCSNRIIKDGDYCPVHFGIQHDKGLKWFTKVNSRWKKVTKEERDEWLEKRQQKINEINAKTAKEQ